MEPDLTQERRQIHVLLDQLSADKLNAVRRVLEVMVDPADDPLARALAKAPVETEPISAEEAAALDEAHASIARVEGIPQEEVLREFGIAHKS